METTFDGNSAQQLGGALLVTSIWAPTLTNCTFRNNYLSTTRIVSEGAWLVGRTTEAGVSNRACPRIDDRPWGG